MSLSVESVQSELLQSYRQQAEMARLELQPLQMLVAYQRDHITRLETENRNQAYEVRKAHEMLNQLNSEPKATEVQPLEPIPSELDQMKELFSINKQALGALNEAIAHADSGFIPLGESSQAFEESVQPT